MTDAIYDEGIEYVTFTFKLKSNPALTGNFTIGQRYYAANEIFFGSPEIYPCLASPIKNVGLQLQQYAAGVKNTVSIKVDGREGFQWPTFGFADLADDYEIHDGVVKIYFVPRSTLFDQNSGATNTLRQTLYVTSYRIDPEDGEMTLTATQRWFKNYRLGRTITEDNLGVVGYNFQGSATGLQGEIGFGATAVIDAPQLDEVTGVGFDPVFILFDGWTLSNTLRNRSVNDIYASTTNVALNNRGNQRWFLLDTDFNGSYTSSYRNTNDSFAGYYAAAPTSYDNMNGFDWGQDFQPVENHLMVGLELYLDMVGTVTYDDGEFKVNVYEYNNFSTGLTTTRPLASANVDPSTISTSGGKVAFVFDQPLLLVGGQKYFFEYTWSREDDVANSIAIGIVAASSSFVKSKSVTEAGWQVFSGFTPVSYFWALDTDGTFAALSTAFVDLIQFSPPGGFQNDFVTNENVRYKVIVDGIEDDGSGTLTGTANKLLTLPSDIMIGVLAGDRDHGFGVGLSTSEFDVAAFRSVATSQNSAGITALRFAYKGGQTPEEFIKELAYYGTQWVYQGRDGLLTTVFPTYKTTPDHTLAEADFGQYLTVTDFRELPHETIINTARQLYGAEYFEVTEDARRNRTESGEQVKIELVLDENDATYGSIINTSITKYGRREHTKALPWVQNGTVASAIQTYYVRRFLNALQETELVLPRVFFYDTFEVAETVQVQHRSLPYFGGDTIQRDHLPGSVSTNYEAGIPTLSYSGQAFTGEIFSVLEDGNNVIIRVQTRGDYS